MNVNLFKDKRGVLAALNFKKLPFKVKRVFCVFDVPKNTSRGDHAHHKTEQYLFCLKGKIEVRAFDKKNIIKKTLYPGDGFYVDKKVWDIQKFLENDSILLVCCSTEYNKNDYIFKLKDFIN